MCDVLSIGPRLCEVLLNVHGGDSGVGAGARLVPFASYYAQHGCDRNGGRGEKNTMAPFANSTGQVKQIYQCEDVTGKDLDKG